MDQKIKLTDKERAFQIHLAAAIIEHKFKWEVQRFEWVKGIGYIPGAFKAPEADSCPAACVHLGSIIRLKDERDYSKVKITTF